MKRIKNSYLKLLVVVIGFAFSHSKVKTTTFVSKEGVPISLSLFANHKFQLIWNEGLLNFELYGTYREVEDELILTREDAFYFEQIYNSTKSDLSYLNMYTSYTQNQFETKTTLPITTFDSITLNGALVLDTIKPLLLDASYSYHLYLNKRLIEIEPQKNALFRDGLKDKQLNLVLCYPNYLVSEDEIILKKKGKNQLTFLNLFKDNKLVRLKK